MEFSFFYFLNFYVSKVKPQKQGREVMETNLKQSKNFRSSTTLQKIQPLTSFVEIGESDFFFVNHTNLYGMISENQEIKTKVRKKDRVKYPIIKQQFKGSVITIKSEEELIQMDDNEIIGKLINFPGVLNLWSSLTLQDKLLKKFKTFLQK